MYGPWWCPQESVLGASKHHRHSCQHHNLQSDALCMFLLDEQYVEQSLKTCLLCIEWIKSIETMKVSLLMNHQVMDRGSQRHNGTWLVSLKWFWMWSNGLRLISSIEWSHPSIIPVSGLETLGLWLSEFATKVDSSLFPRTHIVEGERTKCYQLSSDHHMHTVACARSHPYIQINTNKTRR